MPGDAPAGAAYDRRGAAPLITGMGVVAPNGLGTRAWWRATVEGRSGIGPVTLFDASGYPSRLAGEIPDYDPTAHVPSRLLPQTDRMTRLALYAAAEAFADAGIDPAALPGYAAGVVTASTAGGFEFGQRELQALWSKGSRFVSVYQAFAWFYAVNTGQISIRHQLRGPGGVLVSDSTGGHGALAEARRHLRTDTHTLLAGGIDSTLCPWAWTAHLSTGTLSTGDDPATAYRPYACDPTGQIIGEGGALLVLEDPATARARGARSYGALTGYATAFDPVPDRPDGLIRAMQQALSDAGLDTGDIDIVFLDAAGTAAADRAESEALRDLFGPHGVPATAPKTMTGRLGAGQGALDIATALRALRYGTVPPTVNTVPDPRHDLDLVTGRPRRAPLTHALVIGRGHGGFNAATVLSAEPAVPGAAGNPSGAQENGGQR
ncbi:ketosynthase chain-length factor [Streptomyces tremellae]